MVTLVFVLNRAKDGGTSWYCSWHEGLPMEQLVAFLRQQASSRGETYGALWELQLQPELQGTMEALNGLYGAEFREACVLQYAKTFENAWRGTIQEWSEDALKEHKFAGINQNTMRMFHGIYAAGTLDGAQWARIQ
jgi:hypothetical protein